MGSRDGTVVRALAFHQCVPGFDSRTRRHIWVEFVVGSLLCSERFFSGNSGFPLSLKIPIRFWNARTLLNEFLVSSLVMRG